MSSKIYNTDDIHSPPESIRGNFGKDIFDFTESKTAEVNKDKHKTTPLFQLASFSLIHFHCRIEDNFCEEDKKKFFESIGTSSSSVNSTASASELETKLVDVEIDLTKDLQNETDEKEKKAQLTLLTSEILKINKEVVDNWKEIYSQFHRDISLNKANDNVEYIESNLKVINEIPIQCEKLINHISKKKVELPPVNYEKKVIKDNIKTLVLDLDETLIHCDFDYLYEVHDKYIPAVLDDEEGSIPIMIRPGLNKFLKFASENFEVIIYTASDQDYADYIIDFLDPSKTIFSSRLYRESCVAIKHKIITKPLPILSNRRIEDIILIDNSIYSLVSNMDNGYLIPSYYNDKSDRELELLEAYLRESILTCNDVREVNKGKYQRKSIN